MSAPSILWLVVVVLAVAAVALALVATLRRIYWLALFAVLPVGAGLLLDTLQLAKPQNLLFVVALGVCMVALATIAGSPFVSLIMTSVTKLPEPADANAGIPKDESPSGKSPSQQILRGGATIGYLERFALVGSLLLGQAAAIAIIVAIKGLGRFTELDSSVARERFIIGTLVSLTWAALCVSVLLVP
jgi:hypothetical protein